MSENTAETKSQAIIVLTGGNGRITEGLRLLNDKIQSSKINIPKDICCISLGYNSTDTITNATEVEQWVLENNINSFRLVTSSYHMPRAILEIRDRLLDINIIKHPVLTDDFESWKGRFWILTFSEYNKTLLRWMQTFIKKN